MKTFMISLILGIAVLSCDKDDSDMNDFQLKLIGNWITYNYNDSTIIYKKVGNLKDNNYGFSFKLDGNFIERKIDGWCCTPPVTYSDFEGTWILNDSIIYIVVGDWGGQVEYKWKIISLDNRNLSIFIVYDNYIYENE
jgi:hypothetical protein